MHDSYPPVTKLGSEGCRLKGVIRTLAELLLQVKERESERLDAVDIKHAPTIGTMYEGLSKELLAQVIPSELNLQVVSGFLIDGQGGMSGQIDCMLVEGEGERIPYTYDFNWHIKDLVAVFEIKKTLYAKDLADAFAHLRKVKDLEHNYNKTLLGDVTPVNIDSALRAFAETTRLIFPGWEHLDSLDLHHQYIFHTLLAEQRGAVRVVLGYNGYKSESNFRKSMTDLLEANLGVKGYGPGSFPQLIISGGFSLGKANGQPYSAPVQDGMWPFYYSSAMNPLYLLLEYLWTRMTLISGSSAPWGDDLTVESFHSFLWTQARRIEDRVGWHLEFLEFSEDKLRKTAESQDWSPAFVTVHEAVALQRLCAGTAVVFDDPDFLAYLAEERLDVADFRTGLLSTGLVAMAGEEMLLISEACVVLFLPTGDIVAGDNNTGRMTRWIAKNFPAAL